MPCEFGCKSLTFYGLKLICGYIISYSCRAHQALYGEARNFLKRIHQMGSISSFDAYFLTLSVVESLHILLLPWKDVVLVGFLLPSLNKWQAKPTWHRRGAGRARREWCGGQVHADCWNSPHTQPKSLGNSRGMRGSACAFTQFIIFLRGSEKGKLLSLFCTIYGDVEVLTGLITHGEPGLTS